MRQALLFSAEYRRLIRELTQNLGNRHDVNLMPLRARY